MKFTEGFSAGLVLAYATHVLADGNNCIKLKGDKDYTWKADGAFSGEGNINDQPPCFGPGSGGISFGVPNAAKGAAGNTRLECFFPETETDAEFYNCNLSLVDGFSAAVTCETANGGWPNSNNDTAPLGCGYNLMSDCPDDLKEGTCQCCQNKNGAHVSDLGSVDPVFQACKNSPEYPNTAELYFSMKGAYMFKKEDFPITCTVGKGKDPPAAQKVRREAEAGAHQHAAAHQRNNPLHARHVHARSVMDMLS